MKRQIIGMLLGCLVAVGPLPGCTGASAFFGGEPPEQGLILGHPARRLPVAIGGESGEPGPGTGLEEADAEDRGPNPSAEDLPQNLGGGTSRATALWCALRKGFGAGHRYAGQEETARELEAMQKGGLALSAGTLLYVALPGLLMPGDKRSGEQEFTETEKNLLLAGLGIWASAFLYDALHAPIVAGRNRRARVHIGPQALGVTFRF